jgi:hypothetical protein
MNWQKISIERLKDYEAKKTALNLIPEQIKTLELNLTSIRAARTDGTPVKEGGNKREDALINNIVTRQELERNLRIAEKEVKVTETALFQLSEEEREVLRKFFINRSRRHVEELCESLNYEKTRVYEIKERALKRFTMACYGIIEL